MTQTVQCRCGNEFETQVRFGLKQQRRCIKCRPADKKRVRRLRRVSVNRTETPLGRVFLDKRSRITVKGYERLYGADWKKRTKEVWERDKGLCHVCLTFCPLELGEADHYPIPRSKGRRDNIENLKWSHGMNTRENCNTRRMGRVLHWTVVPKVVPFGGVALSEGSP